MPCNAGWTPPTGHPHPNNPPFEPFRKPVRSRMRCRSPVKEAGFALSEIPVPPFRRGLAGNTHLGGDMSDRPATADPITQNPPASWSQRGVSVHEEPPYWLLVACKHHTTREAQPITTSTTLRIRTPSSSSVSSASRGRSGVPSLASWRVPRAKVPALEEDVLLALERKLGCSFGLMVDRGNYGMLEESALRRTT
jgi:hypothetical protein